MTTIHELCDEDLACLRRLVRKLRVPSGHAIIVERGTLVPVPGQADGYRFCACRHDELPSHSGGVNVVRVDRRDRVRAHALTLRELSQEERTLLLGRETPVVFCRWGKLLNVIPLGTVPPDDGLSEPGPDEKDLAIGAENAKRAKPESRGRWS